MVTTFFKTAALLALKNIVAVVPRCGTNHLVKVINDELALLRRTLKLKEALKILKEKGTYRGKQAC